MAIEALGAAVLCAALLVAAPAVPGGAGARSASGLGCLQGSWNSNGIRSTAASGYLGSTRVTGPAPVSGKDAAHYTGLRSTGSRLTDRTIVPTKHGSVTVSPSFRCG